MVSSQANDETLLSQYPFEVRTLSAGDGGGYWVRYNDFNDCFSDGDTLEEALANARLALVDTIAALQAMNLPVPAPNAGGQASGKFVARLPKSMHAQLTGRAKHEGVSLNTLVITFLAERLGQRSAAVAL